MKEENTRNLIEIIKSPTPNGSLNENGEWIWEDIPDVPGDEEPSSEGPQSPHSEPGSTLSYTSTPTAVPLSLGAPSEWRTLETLSFINTRNQEVVKLDASFTLSWTTLTKDYANIGVDYQIMRNGIQIYSSSNIFNDEGKANAKNLEQISFFHIDNPVVGNYNYALQIRVNQHNNTKDATQITKSELAATVYYGVQAKSYLYVSYIEDGNAPNDPALSLSM